MPLREELDVFRWFRLPIQWSLFLSLCFLHGVIKGKEQGGARETFSRCRRCSSSE